MSDLTDKIRAKYPGVYDDMPDADLESAVLAKHPEYKDLATPPKQTSVKPTDQSKFEPKLETGPDQSQIFNRQSGNLFPKEPTSYWGGFLKSILGEPSDLLSPQKYVDNPMLQSAAHPQSAGDLMNLIVPSELSNLSSMTRSRVPEIAKSVVSDIPPEAISSQEHNLLRNAPFGEGQVIPAPFKPTELREPEYVDRDYPPVAYREDKMPSPSPDLTPVGGEQDYNRQFSNQAANPEDILYQQATKQFGMGQPSPESNGPSAVFKGLQETGDKSNPMMPLYDIVGGPNNGSTVSGDKLAEMGIDVPPIPDDARPMSGEQMRAETLANKDKQGGTPQFNPRGRIGMTGNQQRDTAADFSSSVLGDMQSIKQKTGQKTVLESEIGDTRPKMGPSVDNKKDSLLAEAINVPRTLMASMDMSAPLRQGIGLIHKKEFWTSLDDMFKSFGSEKAFDAVQKSIADKPLFQPRVIGGKTVPSFADEAGLKLTDLNSLSQREESIMSSWAEKVPGVRASNRAYTAFLNKLRSDTFESLINDGKVFGADGTKNVPLARGIADFVNTATGRGSLGKLESSAVALNSTFFAPRLIASRLKMLNPAYYIMADPFVRKEALKSLFAIAGTGLAVGQLAKMAGAKVESDSTSSDFGKIKIGNTRIDPFAGFQQYVVAASRLMQGKTKSSTSGREYNLGEKFGRQTRLDVVERFAESKTNPAVSFTMGILRGKDYTGQPFNIPEEVASRFTPIFLQDLKQLATESPKLLGDYPKFMGGSGEFHPQNLPLAIPSWFGMGVQNYQSR